jgi:hypothetical protein
VKVAADILTTVDNHSTFLNSLSEREFGFKPGATVWSPKEIVGHLVDSAQNNIQRFVRAQYETVPRIIYAQNDWVKFGAYQQADKTELIQLWVLLNKQLCRILTTMDPSNYNRESDWGKNAPDVQTLAFMAEDYHKHMIHHLDQLKERMKMSKLL